MQWMPLQGGQLPYCNRESPDGKSEDNDRHGRPHPGQKRPLIGQMIPRPIGIDFFRHCPSIACIIPQRPSRRSTFAFSSESHLTNALNWPVSIQTGAESHAQPNSTSHLSLFPHTYSDHVRASLACTEFVRTFSRKP